MLIKILALEYAVKDKVVTRVHWRAIDEESKVFFDRTTAVHRENSAPMIPYEKLSEEMVIKWLYQYISVEHLAEDLRVIAENEAEQATAVDVPHFLTEHTNALRTSRAAAYQQEADPLFFKAQRGEATLEEWQAKVDEIRLRFAYAGTNP